mmetsp:Transcript_85169/g.244467  ORF Transcript_85169/g.244467 Transcript_85169/m.244467 type:complete len:357 (-) Transcript_85169:188-1258(-)
MEALVVLLHVEPVCDHWSNALVEAADEHALHLVPGLEHLPAVDALDLQALEDHVVPIDGELLRRDAQQSHACTNVQGLKHGGHCAGHAGHLHAHVEALGHPELLHGVLQHGGAAIARPADVDGQRGTALPRQVQAVIVYVCDDNVPRTHMLADRHGHDADGAGTRDEHVLAHEVEGQGRVRGISQGVHEACHIVRHFVVELEDILGGKAEVFCEGTGPINTDTGGRPAQVPPAGAAIAAHSARDVTFANDAGTQLQAPHLGAELLDHTTVLVANDHRGRDGALRPVVPLVDVDVGAADGRLLDLDQHVIRANRGLRHVHEGQALTAVLLHERLHACAPEDGLDGRRDAPIRQVHCT